MARLLRIGLEISTLRQNRDDDGRQICPVDQLDLRAASTVMHHQILTTGERLWAKDVRAGLFEAAMLTEKLHLDEMRHDLLQDIQTRGTVYG